MTEGHDISDARPLDAETADAETAVAEHPALLGDPTGVAAPRKPAQRRRHPALAARIAATGLSATAMFGIVAGLGAANPPTQVGQESLPAATVAVDPATSTGPTVTLSTPSNGPVKLTANPVIRVEAPARRSAAPIARTSGSR